jgi:hypothetical protein
VAVEAIRPPFKDLSVASLRKLTASPLFPVDVQGDRQYFLSARHAHILDKEVRILTKRLGADHARMLDKWRMPGPSGW